MKFAIVTPWHNPKQKAEFMEAWNIKNVPAFMIMEQDKTKAGCAATKNAGVRKAYDAGAEYICVLDDDCYPPNPEYSLTQFAEAHIKAHEPQDVRMFYPVTTPASRGTPYKNRSVKMKVGGSMGYWLKNGDYDAVHSLVLGGPDHEMGFADTAVHGRYFPLSGMNFCFHRDWIDEVKFINVPRFDDIWMGFIWQKIAFDRGFCFSLKGPPIIHVRQSNVWQNLRDEAPYLEMNETIWSVIHASVGLTAPELRQRLFGSFEPTLGEPPPEHCLD